MDRRRFMRGLCGLGAGAAAGAAPVVAAESSGRLVEEYERGQRLRFDLIATAVDKLVMWCASLPRNYVPLGMKLRSCDFTINHWVRHCDDLPNIELAIPVTDVFSLFRSTTRPLSWLFANKVTHTLQSLALNFYKAYVGTDRHVMCGDDTVPAGFTLSRLRIASVRCATDYYNIADERVAAMLLCLPIIAAVDASRLDCEANELAMYAVRVGYNARDSWTLDYGDAHSTTCDTCCSLPIYVKTN